MSFLKRNINMALLVVILVVVLLAAGTTILFQQGLSARTQEYETTSMNLSECMASKNNYEAKLEETESSLVDVGEDVRKYDIIYAQCREDLDDSKAETATKQQELISMTIQKDNFKAEVAKKVQTIATLNTEIADLNKIIASKDNKIEDLEDELDICGC